MKRERKSPGVDGRPSVLGVRFGVNPNSSSLGVVVTYLMMGGTLAVMTSLALGAWLRGWQRRLKVEEFGKPEEAPGADEGGGSAAAAS
jgi:hypothetical protein